MGKPLTATQRDELLLQVFKKVNFLTDEMRVNGDEGTAPLVGIQNIEQGHHNDLKVVHTRLDNLEELTRGLKTSNDLKKSVRAWLKERPVIGALARNPKLIWLWLLLISAITGALFGFRII